MVTEKEKLSNSLDEKIEAESKKSLLGLVKALVWTAIGFAGLYKAFGHIGSGCEALGRAEAFNEIKESETNDKNEE